MLEVQGYVFPCPKEQLRTPKVVRIGIAQFKAPFGNDVGAVTVAEHVKAVHKLVEEIVTIAARGGVNILCLQEAWSKYDFGYFF